jgi:hypothetical protein
MATNIDSVVESVIIDGLKNISAAASIAQAVMYQDQAASRNRLNIIAESLTAKSSKSIQENSIQDAVADATVNRGSSDASIGSLLAALNSGGIGAKTVAMTPPETGVSRAFADLAALSALIKST